VTNDATADQQQVHQVQALLLRHSELLKGFIYTLLHSHADADDVFQEVFLTATAKAADFQIGTNFLAWARAIARFKVLRHLADAKRRPRLASETLEALADEREVEEDLSCLDWERERRLIQTCLGKLGPSSRRLVELRYIEDLKPREMAARLGRSVGGISVALAKVRSILQRCFEHHGGTLLADQA